MEAAEDAGNSSCKASYTTLPEQKRVNDNYPSLRLVQTRCLENSRHHFLWSEPLVPCYMDVRKQYLRCKRRVTDKSK